MSKNAPQSPMSAGELEFAIREIGKTKQDRSRLLEYLKEFESTHTSVDELNVREAITGPIVDCAFGFGSEVSKQLKNGMTFNMRYTSKIVRDFIMSDDQHPDHVWEPQTTKALLDLSKSAKNVVVGGAYFGDQAILVADNIREQGTVHCFDLSAENTKLLRSNAITNQIKNISINEIGLWSTTNVKLVLEGEDSHASPVVANEGFCVTTIEAYLEKNTIENVDLIMLDIEGGELEALKGAKRFLEMQTDCAPKIIFEIHSSYTNWDNGLGEADIVKYLTSKNYSVFAIRDYQSNVSMNNKPIELVDLDSAYLEGPPHGFNMLATKDPSSLNKDLYKMVKGVSPKLLKHRSPKLHSPIF